jgi:hypothetical protein
MTRPLGESEEDVKHTRAQGNEVVELGRGHWASRERADQSVITIMLYNLSAITILVKAGDKIPVLVRLVRH